LVLLAGSNPSEIQILLQVFNVFVLPLVIIGIILLINNDKVMLDYKTGYWINVGLGFALMFACIISYNGVSALIGYF
jgi:manganese transport protein